MSRHMQVFILLILVISVLITFVALFLLLRYLTKILRQLTSNQPFAVLDMKKVVEQTTSFKQAHIQVEEYRASIIEKINFLQSETQKTNAPVQDSIETLKKLYASSLEAYEKSMNLLLSEIMQNAIKTLSSQEKINIIVPSSNTLFYNQSIDITEKMIEILALMDLEIPPIPEFE